MKIKGRMFLLMIFSFFMAGCAHLAGAVAYATENPEVGNILTAMSSLFGSAGVFGTITGFLAYLVELAKRKKECAKLAAIAAGVQDFLNNAKDKDIAEALKSAMRVQALGADLKGDIDKELAYLRQKGIIPADTSNT